MSPKEKFSLLQTNGILKFRPKSLREKWYAKYIMFVAKHLTHSSLNPFKKLYMNKFYPGLTLGEIDMLGHVLFSSLSDLSKQQYI